MSKTGKKGKEEEVASTQPKKRKQKGEDDEKEENQPLVEEKKPKKKKKSKKQLTPEGDETPVDEEKKEEEEEPEVGVMQIDPSKPLDEQLIHSDWLAELPKTIYAEKDVGKGLPVKINKARSNNIVLIENCNTAEVLDSAVIASRTVRVIDCVGCQFVFETIDLRKCEVFGAVDCEFVYMSEPALLEPSRVLWRDGCYNNKVTVGDLQGFFLYKVSWEVLSCHNAPNTTSSPLPLNNDNKEKEKEKEKDTKEEGQHWITCFDELLKVQHYRLTEKGEEGEWQLTPEGRAEMKRLVPMVTPCLPGEEELDSCYKEFHRDFVAEHLARKKKEEAKRKRKEEKEKEKEAKEKEDEDSGEKKKKKKKKKKKAEKEKEEEKVDEEIEEEKENEKVYPLRLPKKEEILAALRELEANPPDLSAKQLERAYDAERNEYEEDEAIVKEKAKEVAALIRSARYCVVYSGAGISTSADIPDFRGPQGVWTQQAKFGSVVGPSKGMKVTMARPTYAHYAITELTRRHLVKFVISTNMDGLHLRSGLSPHLLMEQHGNSYKEICEQCKMTYMRDYKVTDWVANMREHYTTRMCDYCVEGKLMDTIVHFSEKFRGEHDLAISLQQSVKADLVLVLGTSMNVQPNAVYTSRVFKNPNGRMVVVNLQKTPYDRMSAIRVFAKTDNFMAALMEALEIGDNFDRSSDALLEWSRLEKERAQKKEAEDKKDKECIIA